MIQDIRVSKRIFCIFLISFWILIMHSHFDRIFDPIFDPIKIRSLPLKYLVCQTPSVIRPLYFLLQVLSVHNLTIDPNVCFELAPPYENQRFIVFQQVHALLIQSYFLDFICIFEKTVLIQI